MRSLRNNPALSQIFPSLAQELFQEITASGEVLFVALYAPGGQLLLASTHGDVDMEKLLPRGAFDALDQLGHWHGMAVYGKQQALVIGLQARPGVASICGIGQSGGAAPAPDVGPDMDNGMMGPGMMGPGGSEGGEHHGMGQGMGMGQGRGRNRLGQAQSAPGEETPIYFVAGLNAEKNLAQFHLYRRAALLQTGYVFLAAVVLWSLAFAYLRRRDQASRVGRLERFQSKLLDNMPDGLVTLGLDGEILAANGSARKLLTPLAPPKPEDADAAPLQTRSQRRGRRRDRRSRRNGTGRAGRAELERVPLRRPARRRGMEAI